MKVVVAMSGGVDSSVVAGMMKEAGHEVIGITLQLYKGASTARKGACCAMNDIYDAKAAAKKIDIPHYTLNYEDLFREEVVKNFIDSYAAGYTPIPCVQCNQKVKFKDLLKMSKELGADALATGHYVRRIDKDNIPQLHKGLDQKKDQSYFMFTTKPSQLKFLLFPLGNMQKSETRKLADKYGLANADKPDSQDICFVPDGGYIKVIEKLKPGILKPGEIVSEDGLVLGEHNGIAHFTIGQRKGIGISSAEPLYVLHLDPNSNRVVVGPKESLKETSFSVENVNWISEIESDSFECEVKVRSLHCGSKATIHKSTDQNIRVELHDGYFGITPGQACVMYRGTQIIGGGWIKKEKVEL